MTPIEVEVRDHLEWMQIHNYAATTIKCRERYLGYFVTFTCGRGAHEAKDVDLELLLAYQHSLFAHRKRDGQPLSFGTQAQRLIPVSQFFSWLRREHRIVVNPATDLLMPRPDRRLPEATLSASEMATLLATPDVSRPLGLRDRAVLEVFYSCGLRRSELISLWVRDVDFDRGTLFVRRGKGAKDRYVPVGERALFWVRLYTEIVRTGFVSDGFPDHLFLSSSAPRCARTGCVERCAPTWPQPASPRRAAVTSCATPWPPSCSRVAPTSDTWPRCSDMPVSKPPSATPE
jgi:integrase/recombinase XerD